MQQMIWRKVIVPWLLPWLAARAARSTPARKVLWTVVSAGTAIIVAILVRKLIAVVWERAFGEAPPEDPAEPGFSWPTALSWAVAGGVGAGVGQLVGRRLAAAAWEQAFDEPPPLEA